MYVKNIDDIQICIPLTYSSKDDPYEWEEKKDRAALLTKSNKFLSWPKKQRQEIQRQLNQYELVEKILNSSVTQEEFILALGFGIILGKENCDIDVLFNNQEKWEWDT